MVATDIDDLGALGERPDLGLLQVLQVIVVRGIERGAQRPVVAGDDNTAPPSGHLGVNAVLDTEADVADSIVQNGGVLVVADTTDVDNAVGGEHVLGAAGRVLGRAASDQLGVIVVQEVLVEGEVRVLGEDGVVGLEVVLGQESVIASGLDVWDLPLVLALSAFPPRLLSRWGHGREGVVLVPVLGHWPDESFVQG